MRFANYGRKSVFSDKSDSIDNQFRMSRDYCDMRFPGQIESWERYSDEDFSGANTDRPDLKRLMDDIKNGLVDALVVYQLDRLSRDVRDFANIYSTLEERNVMFVSIKENIDTTTPIGRAMMYVTVVFAQMERETIANRVSDNMLGLAKKGWWISGSVPIGYKKERVSANGRKHTTLVPDPDGKKDITWLYDTFLDNNYSLKRMETAFRNQDIKTPGGAFFSASTLWRHLTVPYYVEATTDIYDYFENKGCQMDPGSPREKWDGSHGVLVHGRIIKKPGSHSRTAFQVQPPEKWLVCLGSWEPIIPAGKWLSTQARIEANTFDKKKKYDVALLKGVLRCSCGRLMAVAHSKYKDKVYASYFCPRRQREGSSACSQKQIICQVLDEKVLSIFREIEVNDKAVMKYPESVKLMIFYCRAALNLE
ncbi:MAG: recombinase family protein, partial [Lachnospiraceae bacterium]|nr:recombinase family protein [Lachnospiraceae bacterium]